MPVDRIVFRLNLNLCYSVSFLDLQCLMCLPYVQNNDNCCSLQRFYMVKPCPKEMKCDVEVSTELTYLF